MNPRRNVELKARDPDPERTLAAALAHGAVSKGTLAQTDTYFSAPNGRLKLREEGQAGEQRDCDATLISYARADAAEARLSAYHLVPVPDPEGLKAALDETLGTVVVVRKRRRLLLWQGVRIHLDDVDGLGDWVELEAVAPSSSDLAAEHDKVAELRAVLGMSDDRVVADGYAAMLLAGSNASPAPQAADPADPPDPGASRALVDAARAAMARAYVPYSHFHVGAALRDETGAIHAAANVENAAYPQGQCAEASAIGVLVAAGGARIQEIAVMADTDLITPCGGCRQRLAEFAGAGVPVHLCGPEGVRRTVTLGELLPLSFSAQDLEDTP